jgi:hypothetical protein
LYSGIDNHQKSSYYFFAENKVKYGAEENAADFSFSNLQGAVNMPQTNALDIAQDLATTAGKSILSKAADAITPDVIVNLYHKLAKSKISLTNEKEIAGFNGFIDALTSFCDPNQPLNIDPDIAACWRIFTYKKINDYTYQFENPFKFAEINDLYQQRQTVKGRTYWDYPFTSSILGLAASSPALKGNAKQSLVRLVFGYITSIAVVTATFDTESKKYEAIKHLDRVVNALINEKACRRHLFDERNTQVLVQISNRITQFFSVKHAEREAAFIPEAVSNLKRISREIASQLFFILLISTEGNNKKTLTQDYHRLSRGLVNNDIANPLHFSINNPFATMLKESSKLLNALHDEPNGADILKTLEVPEVVYIHKYLVANLVLALQLEKSWVGKPTHGLLYFFMQKVDLNTQASGWMEETDVDDQHFSVSQLARIAYWLKFSLTIASVAKDLNLLLSMEGQRWLAKGHDAQIIQQFIIKLQADLGQFKAETSELQKFLRGRLRANCGREHHLFKLVHKLNETSVFLFEKGVQPLLNIEEKYLVIAEYMHDIRRQFFSRIITVLNQSHLGFTFVPEPMQAQLASPFCEPHDLVVFSKKPPSPGQFLQCELTARLSNWCEEAFNSSTQDAFSAFWRDLLYVEKDSGLNQGKKLPKLRQFHQKYLHDVKKIKAQYHLAQEVSGLLKSPRTSVYQWAENFVTMIYKNALAHDVFLAQKITALSQDIAVSTKKGADHLTAHLHITAPNEMAWNETTYHALLDTLMVKFGLAKQTATHFLVDIARQLLQCHQTPDPELSDALDALLNTALNHLVSYAAHQEKRAYWNDICSGLMMLGANPLTWMDARMAERRLVTEEDSHGFFVASRQATIFLSVITHRARYLGETSLHLTGKFDELLHAIEAFGQRLYSCVSDDASWWWALMRAFGVANQGGARLERASLFWAAIRWLYISLNEQLNQCETEAWSAQSMYTLQSYASVSKLYTLKVPRADFRYNQGFATWQRLDTAFKDYADAIALVASLRRQKAVAIELDVKTLEIKAAQALVLSEREQRAESESKLSRLEAHQRTSLQRHLKLSLDKMLKKGDAHPILSEKLTYLIEEVSEVHELSLETAQASLIDVITQDERYASLTNLVCRGDQRPTSGMEDSAHTRLSMFQPAVASQANTVPHRKVA